MLSKHFRSSLGNQCGLFWKSEPWSAQVVATLGKPSLAVDQALIAAWSKSGNPFPGALSLNPLIREPLWRNFVAVFV